MVQQLENDNMKTLRLYNEDVRKIILEENGILSIIWTGQNEINIIIEIDWNGQENMKNQIDFHKNIKSYLSFEFATDIDFNFKHNDIYTIGAPEISEFKFKKTAEYKYEIEFIFHFNPVGHIKFNCSDFYFEVIERSKNDS